MYPMHEQKGESIHNVLDDRYHLMIPDQFKSLKKNFLEMSRRAIQLSFKTIRDMILNILGFIPFGYFFFKVISSKRFLKAQLWQLIIMTVTAGAGLSLIIEMLQTLLPARYSSLTDLIYNIFGTGIGAFLSAVLLKKQFKHQTVQLS
jgi:glycopeptide antibiotics resistance protein